MKQLGDTFNVLDDLMDMVAADENLPELVRRQAQLLVSMKRLRDSISKLIEFVDPVGMTDDDIPRIVDVQSCIGKMQTIANAALVFAANDANNNSKPE